MTWRRGPDGPSRPKLCGLSVEYLFRIQRNGGLEIEKRIGIWIINFKPLILNLEMMYMSKKFT
jgi:hypothetical protein